MIGKKIEGGKKYKITINNYSADCKYLQIGNFIFLFLAAIEVMVSLSVSTKISLCRQYSGYACLRRSICRIPGNQREGQLSPFHLNQRRFRMHFLTFTGRTNMCLVHFSTDSSRPFGEFSRLRPTLPHFPSMLPKPALPIQANLPIPSSMRNYPAARQSG